MLVFRLIFMLVTGFAVLTQVGWLLTTSLLLGVVVFMLDGFIGVAFEAVLGYVIVLFLGSILNVPFERLFA